MSTFFRLAVLLLLVFLLLQLIRPPLPNTPVVADLQAPPDVQQIFRTACYSCHSNETQLSWFDYPVPAYWLVVRDVKRGRERLNFSEFSHLPAPQQQALLFESLSQIELGAMPLPAYQHLHPESRLAPAQIATLKSYLRSLANAQTIPSVPPSPAPAERAPAANPDVSPAPNGIPFPAGYKAWKTLSSTERFDNHSLRVILGNDVAVQAAANRRINPWPDGAIFAKVAWHEELGPDGLLHPGAFYQVEFMIRDSQKYAATNGWGWARWRGAELKPYGKDASFTGECIGCHAPLTQSDLVFTAPITSQLGTAHP